MAIPTNLQDWREYVTREPQRPDHLSDRELKALSARALDAYNERRFAWLTADTVLGTPDVQKLRRLWATLRAETLFGTNTAAKMLSVSGAPTSGKTTAALWIARDHERNERRRHPARRPDQLQPSLYVVTPPATTPKMLLVAFCNVLGLPHARASTAQDLIERVHAVLRTLQTSLIVLDEIHNVQSNRQIGAEAASTLKLFAERLDCAFILNGIDLDRSPVFAGAVGEQLASRTIRYDMRGYRYNSAQAREEWAELLASCCDILPLTRQSDQVFADAAPWLFEVTGGSIGRLRSLLRRAAIDAITSGRERVTMADMEVFANQGGHSHKPASTPRAARNLDAASA